jgi:glycosyltransferase involved in cell wall biosynthesis
MNAVSTFREGLRRDFSHFVQKQAQRFAEDDVLRMDLHCHDRNSDVPDELLGRILRWPETWIPTDDVVKMLRQRGMDALTITNHNNARSCFELLERGMDVLVGAEFTCRFPKYETQFHVLAYGFTPAQEQQLNSRRHDLTRFLDYTCDHGIVTVLAHPLFLYAEKKLPPLEMYEALTLMFDNFEVINGQRDSWQNLLMASWIETLDEERITELSHKTGISPTRYCLRPYRKTMTGGSDCHLALFLGTAGVRLHVPNLAERRKDTAASALALEAMAKGEMAPFGSYSSGEKLTATLLDYFCQAAMYSKDPGLIRLLLHKGTPRDKLTALLVTNGMMELRRHRVTARFLKAVHQALHGKKPGFLLRRFTSRPFKPLLGELDQIADAQRQGGDQLHEQLCGSIPRIFSRFNEVLAERIGSKLSNQLDLSSGSTPEATVHFLEKLEIPANLRALLGDDKGDVVGDEMSPLNVSNLADGLPFPLLAAVVIGGARFTANRVMFNHRQLLDDFADRIGKLKHPRRALWLTDTFIDKNGVAGVLRLFHQEVRRRNLPIDFAVCDPRVEPDDHLIVLDAIADFETPLYPDQRIRICDMMQLQQVFLEGAYDRVVCSTEAPMGVLGLYLKQAFMIPAYFYLHTDWMDFARRALHLEQSYLDRLRRIMRALYRSFDGVLTLNSEQADWLRSPAMGLDDDAVMMTAHWANDIFRPGPVERTREIPDAQADERYILFAGRVSEEKGVLELPEVMRRLQKSVPQARLVVAGEGPALAELKKRFPEGRYLGWTQPDQLARLYAAADALILPSRFDTFGCVVLEALNCGLPVLAYAVKGPKDIVQHGKCGFLADTSDELVNWAARLLQDASLHQRMREAAIERAKAYRAGPILDRLLDDIGLGDAPRPRKKRSSAPQLLAAG